MVGRIVDQSEKMIASHVVATRNISTQELFKMKTKARNASMQKITSEWDFTKEIVLAYNRDLKWGRKKSKRLREFMEQLGSDYELEEDLSMEVHNLLVTPYDGIVTIHGIFYQDFESLDEFAAVFGVGNRCRIFESIKEHVESVRVKLPKQDQQGYLLA